MKYQSDDEEKFMKWKNTRKSRWRWRRKDAERTEHEMRLSNVGADVEALGKPLCNQLPSITI